MRGWGTEGWLVRKDGLWWNCNKVLSRFQRQLCAGGGGILKDLNCYELRPRAAPRGGVRVLREGPSWDQTCSTYHWWESEFLWRRVKGSGQTILASTVATRWVRPYTSWSLLSLNQTMLSTNIYRHLLCAFCFLCVQSLPLTQSYLMNENADKSSSRRHF